MSVYPIEDRRDTLACGGCNRQLLSIAGFSGNATVREFAIIKAVIDRLRGPEKNRVVYRFGVFELDSETGELRKQGIRVRLSGQPFQVLLLCIEREGECISREELREALWPNHSWGDLDLRLNKVMNRVREVLGDSAESPRYVETIPRVGYRFIFPVQKTELAPVRAAGADSGASESPRPSFVKRPRMLVFALVGVIGAVVVNQWGAGVARNPKVLDPQPLTSYVGTESGPSFSPDGSRVAFAWNGVDQDNFDIYVLRTSDGGLERLTEQPEREFAPCWSRDGSRIAFLRQTAQRTADVMVVPAAGGRARKLSQVTWVAPAPELDWTADSRWIAVSDNTGGGPSRILFVSAATGERRAVTSPPPDSRGDLFPSISPDGRRMVFTRYVTAQWNDVFSVALGSEQQAIGVPVRLSDLKMQIGQAVWLAGGRELVFAAGGWGDERFLYRMAARKGAEPESLGNVRIAGLQPAYSRAARALAFVRGGTRWSIWEIDVAAAERGVPALKRVIASSSSDRQPDFSSDGESIVFSSNRQRSLDLWVAPLQGTDARQLVSFQESGATAPRWSPDGAWVAFESRRGGQSDVYLYRVADGSTRNLTNNPAEDFLPSWSGDGQYVYFSSDRSGTRQIYKVPRDGGTPAMVTSSGGAYAIESPDARHLYYTTSLPPAVLRLRSIEDGTERDIATGVITVPGIGATAKGVFYLTASGSEAESVQFYDLASGSSRELVRLPEHAGNGFSVSRDGKRILLVLREQEGSDLLLMRNFD